MKEEWMGFVTLISFFYSTCLPPPPRPGRDDTPNENGGNISLERAMCLDQFKILVSLGTGPQQCDSPGKALLALLLEVSGGKENASHRFKNKLLSLTEANRKEVCNIKMATCKQSQLIFLFRLKNYQCLGEHS